MSGFFYAKAVNQTENPVTVQKHKGIKFTTC